MPAHGHFELSLWMPLYVLSNIDIVSLCCLSSATDVAAAANIGRVLAQRCLQSGIVCMLLEPLSNSDKSEKVSSAQLSLIFTDSANFAC